MGIFKFFNRKSASKPRTEDDDIAALFVAIRKQDIDTIKKTHAAYKSAMFDWKRKSDLLTPIHAALTDNKLQSFTALLDLGASPEQECSYKIIRWHKFTLSERACFNKQSAFVRVLLERGINIPSRHSGCEDLRQEADQIRQDYLTKIGQIKPRPSRMSDAPAIPKLSMAEARKNFFAAIENGDQKSLKTITDIVQKYPDALHWTKGECRPPLIAAIKAGKTAVFKHLVSLGADVNADDQERDPKFKPAYTIHYAVNANAEDIVRFMIEQGADLEKTSPFKEGKTVRALAQSGKFNNILDLLDAAPQIRHAYLKSQGIDVPAPKPNPAPVEETPPAPTAREQKLEKEIAELKTMIVELTRKIDTQDNIAPIEIKKSDVIIKPRGKQ